VTIAQVKAAVDHIRALQDDDERAHAAEDELHQDVLAWIAAGHLEGDFAREAAALALTTRDIIFARWCA
jgi:hypothetical protein